MAAPPLLLVVNDDGVASPGLVALAAALRPLGEVVVFAPATEQSGVSHALSIWTPVRTRPASFPDGTAVTAVEGTPADCVKIAVLAALRRRPAAVLSGINRGLNTGVNLFYSGTVAGAMEAAILGVPSAAISLDVRGVDDYGPSAAVGAAVARLLIAGRVPAGTLLNVNVPPGPLAQMAGVRLTHQSRALWDEHYDVTPDPADPQHGRLYQTRGTLPRERYAADSDMGALRDGAVSITPLEAGFVPARDAGDASALCAAVAALLPAARAGP